MDKSQAKKYTKIAVTLGVIAGGSALLIGLANVITAGPIAKHELEKKLESIRVVYGDDADYGNEVMIGDEYKKTYPSLISYYQAKDEAGSELGHVFVCEGKNQFGPIKMAIGIDSDNSFGKVSLIVNGQTLPNEVNAYVDQVNKDERPLSDVKCGATFGATLINNMGNEALSYYKAVIKNEAGADVPSYVTNIFGENVNYSEKTDIANTKYQYVKSYYTVTGQSGTFLGHVFVCEGTNDFGPIKMSIGLDADLKVTKIFLIENGQTNGKDKVVQNEYVDKVNNGSRPFDDVACGATVGATLINKMGKEAQMYVKAEINKDLTDFTPYLKETFGEKVDYIRHNIVIDAKNTALKDYWTAFDSETNKNVGRAYHAELNKNHYMIGVNIGVEDEHTHQAGPQTLKSIYWVNSNDSDAGKAALAFIEKFNKGEATLDADATDNAIIVDIKAVLNQALDHANHNLITQPVDVTDLLAGTFGEDKSYCEHQIIDDIKYSNMVEYWNVKDTNRNYVGRAYHLEMPGEHGSIHAVIGVVNDPVNAGKFYKVSMENNIPIKYGGQAAHDALDVYIAGLNDGTIDINDADAIKNGATGTSGGVRNLALMAVKHYCNNTLANEFLPEIFTSEVSYIEHNMINDEHVYESWNVINKDNNYLGRVYHTRFAGRHATINALVGFNSDGSFKKAFLINKADSEYGAKLVKYVELLNEGSLDIHDDIHNGATASTSAVATMIREAEADFKLNPVLPLLKDLSKLNGLYEGKTVSFAEHRKVSEKGFENVVEYWVTKDSDGKPIGAAYHCALPGKHAIMEILVSVNSTKDNQGNVTNTLGKVILLNKAPNKYGEILQSYVDGLNDGSIDVNDDIHNGATSSSNGVKSMVQQSIAHLNKNQLDADFVITDAMLQATFGNKVTYKNKTAINDLANDNLIASWDVVDSGNKTIGRVYHGVLPGEHGVVNLLVGINADGTLAKINWVNAPEEGTLPPFIYKYTRLAKEYIEKINNGQVKITDDVHNGATGTTGGIVSLCEQALNHYSLNKIAQGE